MSENIAQIRFLASGRTGCTLHRMSCSERRNIPCSVRLIIKLQNHAVFSQCLTEERWRNAACNERTKYLPHVGINTPMHTQSHFDSEQKREPLTVRFGPGTEGIRRGPYFSNETTFLSRERSAVFA